MSQEERQAMLRKRWGFTCQCPFCQQSESERTVHDNRRREIGELKAQIVAALRAGQLNDAGMLIIRMRTRLAEEDLAALTSDLYQSLAAIYWAVGETETAVRFLHNKLNILDDYHHLDPRNRTADLEAEITVLGGRP